MEYELMNKNDCWLSFSCSVDEFGEVMATERQWNTMLRPIGYRNLQSFLERRRAPKHRKHIRALLEQYGCDDLEGFLRVTYALSLNDTFWVRERGSSLVWEDVSLYRNEFNEVISTAAFDGVYSSESFSSTSPEFGTDGRYAKCWVRQGDDVMLYKSGSDTYEIEPLSEYLASQVAEVLCPNFVPYDLDFYHGRLVSKCRLFTSEEYGLSKAGDLKIIDRTILALLSYFEGIGYGDAFRRMCVLDALILNTDRHLGNFGVLVRNDTMEIVSAAPVFDHNRTLLFNLDEDQLAKPDWYIQKCKPRLGTDFILTAKGLLTDAIRADLVSMEGFEFQQHPRFRADGERLAMLSHIVDRQRRVILDAL